MAEILKDLPIFKDPNLLVGFEGASDAAIYRLTDDLALICTLDFFTPIVDDPYWFGQIAAANSLSDVYAMGGKPLLALNIVCFPRKEDKKILKEILRGGIDKIKEAEAVLAGGHSVDDQEIKYGLSVVGLVHPEKYVSNSGTKPGDVLFLTKPLGTGILATAIKGGLASSDTEKRMIEVMATLNKAASQAMTEVGVSAATDITGFGLLGHALEMAQASRVTLVIQAKSVPVIKEALEFARMGIIPEGDYANVCFCQNSVEIQGEIDEALLSVLYDAQTSGGLLISVPETKADEFYTKLLEKGVFEAARIGQVEEGAAKVIVTP
ncbi:selenide, water dikinase [Thermodesulfatator autotrophicus]|uniref:Selenide, water dikinase n=1 Tax=Thermodesulfatator autotrophicus TaxID=1795632 RepID=A0A177E7W9_9BACT|nr:selenide, water dikinase [Thermodesulfatator autotrophicus]